MSWEGLAFQALDGLASASGLFFVAAGLSLIFGVTRIINMAHGSLYMLGTYIAVSLVTTLGGALGFWGGVVLSALIVGLIGTLMEILLLRRIYSAPELFQLLAFPFVLCKKKGKEVKPFDGGTHLTLCQRFVSQNKPKAL